MRIIFFIVVITLLVSCKSEKKEGFTSEQLKGAWFVSNINLSNKDISVFKALKFSELASNKAYSNLFYFDEKGGVQIDTGGVSYLSGTYKITDSIILINAKDYNYNVSFTKSASDDTTKMLLYENLNSNGTEKMVYKFNRITNADVYSVEWKKPLEAKASERTIKNKLKTLLNYYSNYYLMLAETGIGVFNQNELYLPLRLYDGGVGTRSYKEVKGFIDIMGSDENAKKAVEFLDRGFVNPYKYPDKDNLLLEYADVLNHLYKEI